MIIAVILAGGRGTRMKSTQFPKQFLTIGGEPILRLTVDKFLCSSRIDRIVVAAPSVWLSHTKDLLKGLGYEKVSVCAGGATRQESLYNALTFIQQEFSAPDDTIIVSHDVARPFVTLRIIEDNIDAMADADAVDTVVSASDTIVQSVDGKTVSDVPERSQMYQGQTPQTFRLRQFTDIYSTLSETYLAKVTDAVRILAEHGCKVRMVQGELFNIKITTEYDLGLAGYLLGINHD